MSQLDATSKAFDPARLTLARQLTKETKAELADSVEVSASAISQYEKGDVRPSPATVGRLAWALGVQPAFFMAGRPLPRTGEAHFRSLRSSSKAERTQAVAAAKLLNEVVGILERHVRLPKVDIPRHEVDEDGSRRAAEDAAAGTRHAWEVPDGPVGNMVRLLEQRGVIVSRLLLDTRRLDAFSIELGDRPYIILGRDKGDAARSRLDAAHELGHLVMHDEVEPGDGIVERQAHQFGAAFLMPEEQIRPLLPARFDLRRLIELKHQWGVSVAAMLYRSRELGVMTESTYRRAVTYMSSKGYRTNEPAPIGRPEAPTLLSKSLERLSEAGWTLDDLANDVHLPTGRLEDFFERSDQRIDVIP